MAHKLAAFVAAFLVWCLLAYTGNFADFTAPVLVAGALASLIVSLLFAETLALDPAKFLNPVRWFWFAVYLVVWIPHVIAAALHVMYLVLHPDLPIKPGIVKVKTRLQSPAARAALSNSITLTPGTLVIDVTRDGYLYIHLLVVDQTAGKSSTEAVVARYENLIERIME